MTADIERLNSVLALLEKARSLNGENVKPPKQERVVEEHVSHSHPGESYRLIGVTYEMGAAAYTIEATRYPLLKARRVVRVPVENRGEERIVNPLPRGWDWPDFVLGRVPRGVLRRSGIRVEADQTMSGSRPKRFS